MGRKQKIMSKGIRSSTRLYGPAASAADNKDEEDDYIMYFQRYHYVFFTITAGG